MRIGRYLLAACVGLESISMAQSFTPVREQKNLSPAAISKLRKLESLNALPPGEWHFHAGDLAHGESPALDDASWPLVKPGADAPKRSGVVSPHD